MAAKIPVTVVTGFLGSGKTTLLRHLLLHNEGKRIAILVNEFGEIGIDGDLLRASQDASQDNCGICQDGQVEQEQTQGSLSPSLPIVELTNGCLCCTVQEEFLPTMQYLLEQRDRLDAIVIETSGLALPQPLLQAFRWPEIRHAATVDGVITVVDGEAVATGSVAADLPSLMAQRQADPSLDHETPLEELFEDQLACADLVLLSKGDRLDPITLERVHQWLVPQVRPGVKILSSRNGQVPPPVWMGLLAAAEADLEQRWGGHEHDHEHEDHDHDQTIQSIPLTLPQSFQPEALIDSLKILVQEQEIYRIKGFVVVPDKAMRLVVQGVGQRFDWFYDRPWQVGEAKVTQLVVIGKALDAVAIRTRLSQ
ncbi:MAG: cobalamin biosynthesis protein CobW [Cyanobacteriota bacterium]|nr:cobalamin biosynthesis protein CobW [Cyanobacteriota bacterium]